MERIIVDIFTQYGIDIYRSIAMAAFIFARLIATIFQTPFLGGRLVPGQIKVGMSIVLLVVIYPYGEQLTGELPTGFIPLVFLWMKEVFVGFTIGFIASLVFMGVQSAGRLLDTQRGANMANMMDPYFALQASPMGELLFQLMIVIVLSLNGHHFFIKALVKSFEVIPINGFVTISPGVSPFIELILKLTANIFLIALLISAPAIIALFLIDVGFGIVNRVAPQIQVFFLGMPLKTLIGVLMIFLALQLIINQMEIHLGRMIQDVYHGIKLLGEQ